jgi:hypothetical protein
MAFTNALVIIMSIFAVTMTIWLILYRTVSHNGKIIFDKDEETGKITFTLEVDVDPYEIEHMKNISFKVVRKHEIAD